MQTQTERLAAYLKEHKSINPLDAWKHLGIYRLSATVFELRRKGMNIVTNRVNVKNKFGEKCNVANYTLTRKSR